MTLIFESLFGMRLKVLNFVIAYKPKVIVRKSFNNVCLGGEKGIIPDKREVTPDLLSTFF
jgi:hypothetical protein